MTGVAEQIFCAYLSGEDKYNRFFRFFFCHELEIPVYGKFSLQGDGICIRDASRGINVAVERQGLNIYRQMFVT